MFRVRASVIQSEYVRRAMVVRPTLDIPFQEGMGENHFFGSFPGKSQDGIIMERNPVFVEIPDNPGLLLNAEFMPLVDEVAYPV